MDSEAFKTTVESFYDIDRIHSSTEKVLELLKDIGDGNIDGSSIYSSLTKAVFFIILNTPNYKKQVALIDSVTSCSPEKFRLMLLNYTLSNFGALPTDRKDKFYYLISKTFNMLSFRDILGISDLEVQGFIWSKINADKSIIKDWDDDLFLEFMISCRPFVTALMDRIKIPRDRVQKYIDLPMDSKNREMLYGLFK